MGNSCLPSRKRYMDGDYGTVYNKRAVYVTHIRLFYYEVNESYFNSHTNALAPNMAASASFSSL